MVRQCVFSTTPLLSVPSTTMSNSIASSIAAVTPLESESYFYKMAISRPLSYPYYSYDFPQSSETVREYCLFPESSQTRELIPRNADGQMDLRFSINPNLPLNESDSQSPVSVDPENFTSASNNDLQISTGREPSITIDGSARVVDNLTTVIERCIERTLSPVVRASLTDPRTTPRIDKWNINKFDGNEVNLERFFLQVKQLAVAEQVTKEELFQNRIHLFSGTVADFVMMNEDVKTWDDLVATVVEFSRGDISDLDLLTRIKKQRQNEESCAAYVTKLSMMLRSLKHRILESEMCEIIISGFRPSIRSALMGISRIKKLPELLTAAQRVERLTGKHRDNLRKENKLSVDHIESFEDDTRSLFTLKQKKRRRIKSRNSPELKDIPEKGFCLNCGDKNHVTSDCQNESRVLCYHCGLMGYCISNCPICSNHQQVKLRVRTLRDERNRKGCHL